MCFHAEELPQVSRPKTVGSVGDMLGNQRMAAVLWKRRNSAFDLQALLHDPVPQLAGLQRHDLDARAVTPSIRPPRPEEMPAGSIPVIIHDIGGRGRLHVERIDQISNVRGVFDQELRFDFPMSRLEREGRVLLGRPFSR